MTTAIKPLAAPKDNLLGICNALGEDFGFNPLWLRLVLGAAFVIQPVGVVIGYLVLGMVVLVSRLAFPNLPAKSGINTAESDEVRYEEPAYAKAA